MARKPTTQVAPPDEASEFFIPSVAQPVTQVADNAPAAPVTSTRSERDDHEDDEAPEPKAEVESLPNDLHAACRMLERRQKAYDTSALGQPRREALAALNSIRKHWFKLQQGPAAPQMGADEKARAALASLPDASSVLAEIKSRR